MATSFAPSPMANVTVLVYCVTYSTTSAFCIGDTRQQTTTLQETHNLRKSVRNSQLEAYLSVLPSTMSAISFCFSKLTPRSSLCLKMDSRVLYNGKTKTGRNVAKIPIQQIQLKNETKYVRVHSSQPFLNTPIPHNIFVSNCCGITIWLCY